MKGLKYFKSDKIDFDWAMKLNRYSLELIGLWPDPKQTTWEKIMYNLRPIFVFMIITTGVLIPAIHSVIRIHKDIILTIDNLQYTLPIAIAVVKMLSFWWKRDDVTPLINMMKNDWLRPKSPREETIMITRAQTARTIIIVAYSIMGIALIVFTIMPAYGISMRCVTNVTDPGRLLPLQTYYIYDVTKSPQYELTFVWQTIVLFLCIFPYSGVDNFLSLLVFHISGQLDILKDRLVNCDKVTHFVDTLNCYIIDHVRLLRAISIIEDTFNIILLILFLYFGILFVFFGYLAVSMFENEDYQLIRSLAYFITIVTNAFGHMCIYCVVGDILSAQCDQIHYAVYCNKWYSLDPRHARNIILVMALTNKPLYLTVGKIFPLTMATFCNLIKTSAGYISVLLAMKH